MTGVNGRKVRYFLHDITDKANRLDPEFAAALFKASVNVSSSAERLQADIAVKAASLYQGDTDNKKRTVSDSSGKTKYKNIHGLVFDPQQGYEPGMELKLSLTERERKLAMMSPDPKPNWGWVKPGEYGNPLPQPKDSFVEVTRYPVDPSTGKPMMSLGRNVEVKQLGKTIGELRPGSKLMHRAARAFGVVVDALGKFRCPPGTPAANQFTNERGENCFNVSLSQLQSLVGTMTSLLSAPNDRVTLLESMLRVGISAAEIRQAYMSGGDEGLRSLAQIYNIKNVGDKWQDASYRASIPAKIQEALGMTQGAQQRMADFQQLKRDRINALKTKYGIPDSGDEEKDLMTLLRAIRRDPDGASFADLNFYIDGTEDTHRDALIGMVAQYHGTELASRLGIDALEIERKYKDDKANGVESELTRFIDATIERDRQFRIGALEQIAYEASVNPEQYNGTSIYFDTSDRDMGPGTNAVGGPKHITFFSSPAVIGFRGETPPPGFYDMYTAVGGTTDDQWRAITGSLFNANEMNQWVSTYQTDIAASMGEGWRTFGAQVAAHETTHSNQYEAFLSWYESANPGTDIRTRNNDEIFSEFGKFLESADSATLQYVFGVDIDQLIEMRHDALAGAYGQSEQQGALDMLVAAGEGRVRPEDFNKSKNIALLETLAEIGSGVKIGLIKPTPEMEEYLDKFMPPRYVDTSLAPDGSVPNRPSRPVSSPGPVVRPPSGPVVLPAGAGRVIRPTAPSGGRTGGGGRTRVGSWSEDNTARWRDKNERLRLRRSNMMAEIRAGTVDAKQISRLFWGAEDKDSSDYTTSSAWYYLDPTESVRSKDFEVARIANEARDRILARSGFTIDDVMRWESMATSPNTTGGPRERLTPQEREDILDLALLINIERDKLEQEEKRLEQLEAQALASGNIAEARRLNEQKKAYRSARNTNFFRNAGAALNDIVDLLDNTPDAGWPFINRSTFSQGIPSYTGLNSKTVVDMSSAQDASLSPQEIARLDSIHISPPDTSMSIGSQASDNLYRSINNNSNVNGSFERYGLRPPISSNDQDIDESSSAMIALDKTAIDRDVVVEIEIDSPADGQTEIEIQAISSGLLITDDNHGRSGMASRSGAAIASRMLGSKRTSRVLQKMGLSEESSEIVAFTGEMAGAFVIGGPAAVVAIIARRGTRDLGDKGIDIAVERGWITADMGEKIRRRGLDLIAKEGLPDEISNMAEAAKERLLTEENKANARRLYDASRDRMEDVSRKGVAAVRRGAEAAREKLRRGESEVEEWPSPSMEEWSSPSVVEVLDVDKSAWFEMQIKELGQKPAPRKSTIRIVVPEGSKGRVSKDGKVALPPGKIKITGTSDDGKMEAEVVGQMSASEYMKEVENIASKLTSSDNAGVRVSAKKRLEKSKSIRKQIVLSSGNKALSEIEKLSYEKTESIVERLKSLNNGDVISPHVQVGGKLSDDSGYISEYRRSLGEAIAEIKTKLKNDVWDETEPRIREAILRASSDSLLSSISNFIRELHDGMDRRTRIPMTKSSLSKFMEDGKVLTGASDSGSINYLKKLKKEKIGVPETYELIPVEIMHTAGLQIVEQELFERGTMVGSEEFADYGRGIEVVLRAQISPRVAYSLEMGDAGKQSMPVLLEEDDYEKIEAYILGPQLEGDEKNTGIVREILNAVFGGSVDELISKKYQPFIEAFVIGEVSLNDIEHLKVPSSITGIRGRPVASSDNIGGESRIRSILVQRGASQSFINNFFSKGGMIGGGLNPKYLTYLREAEAAAEIRQRLIEMGMPEVLITNKDGIDLYSDETWITPPPSKKRGIDALREIASKEVDMMLDKVMPPKEGKTKEKALTRR